jgi:hypothetical protein
MEFAPSAKDSLLTIFIFLIAVAQALTILLTIRRERDVKELREIVDVQRLHLAELMAWVSGRNAARPRLPKPDTVSEPKTDNAKVSERPKEAMQSRATDGEAAQTMKLIDWQREMVAGLRAALKRGAQPETGTTKASGPVTPKDLPDAIRPDATENELKEQAERARENVTSLHGTGPSKRIR